MSDSRYPITPDYEAFSETELIARCQGGELEAFNVLISRYENRVINLALRYMRDYHQAVDESQEIFLKVFKRLGTFKGDSAFATWLYRVTANHCMNSIRNHRRRGKGKTVYLDQESEDHPAPVLHDSKAVDPEQMYAQKQVRKRLVGLIDQLPDDQRQVVLLCHYEHMSYSEVADVMEVPVTTVRSCLFRARQRLRSWLEQKGGRL